VNVYRPGWTDGRMDGWTDGWMHAWMDGRMDGWMVVWIDRYMSLIFLCIFFIVRSEKSECL